MEKKLGLKPVMDNDFGGKEYKIDKKRIPTPRAPGKVSASAKKTLVETLHGKPCFKHPKPSSCGEINNGKIKQGRFYAESGGKVENAV